MVDNTDNTFAKVRQKVQDEKTLTEEPLTVTLEVRLSAAQLQACRGAHGKAFPFSEIIEEYKDVHDSLVRSIPELAEELQAPGEEGDGDEEVLPFLLVSASVDEVLTSRKNDGMLYASLAMEGLSHVDNATDNLCDGMATIRDLDQPTIMTGGVQAGARMVLRDGRSLAAASLIRRESRTMPTLYDEDGYLVTSGGTMPSEQRDLKNLMLHGWKITNQYMYPKKEFPRTVTNLSAVGDSVSRLTSVVVPADTYQSMWCDGAMHADQFAKYTLTMKAYLREARSTTFANSGIWLRHSPMEAGAAAGGATVVVTLTIFPIVPKVDPAAAALRLYTGMVIDSLASGSGQ